MGYGQSQGMWNEDAGVMYGGHGAHPTGYYSIDDASRVVSQGIEQESGHCQATGIGSFVRISQEITEHHLYSEEQWYGEEQEHTMSRLAGRPGNNPLGQYTPVGDGVVMMLAMACVWAAVMCVRRRKTSK